jgi:hypothetical protein
MTERDAEEYYIFHGHIHRVPKNKDYGDLKKSMIEQQKIKTEE